jgi:hypothetical protein
MVKRVIVDVLIGAVLAFGSQIIQYAAYLLGLAAGLPFPYDSAPVDPGSHPDWVNQISLMSLLSALPVAVLAFVVAWLLKVRGVGEGARRGLIWAAVVVLWHVLIGLGNGTLAALAIPGVWIYCLAFALGPIVAGWLRRERPAA